MKQVAGLEYVKAKNIMATAQNCFLSYNGILSEETLDQFGQKLRQYMCGIPLPPKQQLRAFSLYVEIMQNIIRYGSEVVHLTAPNGNDPSYGMLAISHENDAISIVSGNYVTHQQAELLRQRLDMLSALTSDELRQLFMKTIRQPLATSSKGANLGLIQIMRRSSSPPQYLFDPAENGAMFFTIRVIAY